VQSSPEEFRKQIREKYQWNHDLYIALLLMVKRKAKTQMMWA
jgi:hypothetical protein